MLPRCLSNCRAIGQFQIPISRLRDCTISKKKTSYRILKRGPVLWRGSLQNALQRNFLIFYILDEGSTVHKGSLINGSHGKVLWSYLCTIVVMKQWLGKNGKVPTGSPKYEVFWKTTANECISNPLNDNHIWDVAMQITCDDTCQIW